MKRLMRERDFYTQCAGTDVVAGWCESGSIFVADVRQDLLSLVGV